MAKICLPWAPFAKKCNPNCQILICAENVDLNTNIVNQLTIKVPIKIEPQYVIQIEHHLFPNPWRIINRYLVYDETKNSLTIPIITEHFYQMKTGEKLCHIRLVKASQVFSQIKGNTIFYKCTYYFNNIIYFYF